METHHRNVWKSAFGAGLLAAMLAIAGAPTLAADAPHPATLITGANIFDGTSDKLATGISVLVEGNKITKIGKSITAPAGAAIINANGKVLMPGLIDAHFHPMMAALPLDDLLRVSGMQVITYRSAETFLADDKQPKFDCLVLDVQMSGASGIELSDRLTARGSTVPVIYLTALHEPEVRDLALRTACAAYLRKDESADVVLAVWSAIRAHRSNAPQQD